MLISSLIILSACAGRNSPEHETTSELQNSTDPETSVSLPGSTDPEKSGASESAETNKNLLIRKNNSVVVETAGQKYYSCGGFIYHLTDDKNVELIGNKTEGYKPENNFSDPVLKNAFREIYNNFGVGDSCFFGVDSGKSDEKDIVCFTIDDNSCVKSNVLYTKDQFNNFIKSETKKTNETFYNPQFCISDMHYSDDGYVYFINKGIKGSYGTIKWDSATNRICRFAVDGSGLGFIGTETAQSIAVRDDYIYYINTGVYYTGGSVPYDLDNKKTGIYRIRTDGTDKKLLCKLEMEENNAMIPFVQPRDLHIIGDCLYFLIDSELKRIPVGGGEAETVADFDGGSVQSYCIDQQTSVVYSKSLTSDYLEKTISGIGKNEKIPSKRGIINSSDDKGFADIVNNYLYLNCLDYSYKNQDIKRLEKDEFTTDPENGNCLCRTFPSLRYNLKNNCYEQIFEIIQFRTRADADEFNDTVNYGLVESCHLEWRQINTN